MSNIAETFSVAEAGENFIQCERCGGRSVAVAWVPMWLNPKSVADGLFMCRLHTNQDCAWSQF